MNRPLVWVALAFSAGLLFAALRPDPALALFVLAGIAPLWVLAFRQRWACREAMFLVLCVVLVGAAYGTLRRDALGDELSRFVQDHRDAQVEVRGTVSRVDVRLPEDDYTSFVLDADVVVHRGRSAPLRGRTLVGWHEPGQILEPGARVAVRGKLRAVLGPVNPRVRDFEDYLHHEGIHTRLTVFRDHPDVLSEPRIGSFQTWIARLRQAEATALHRAVPASVRDFALTIWLGDRAHSDRERYPRFVESGTAHILAVSGVHVGIVYASLALFLRGLIRSRRKRTLVIMAALLLFALLAGARVSSLRAAFMLCLYLSANLFERDGDGPTALSIAALVFLVLRPGVLFDPGFLLSFGSVASLLLFGDSLYERFSRLPRGIRQGLSATLAVQILPLPLAAHFFHVIPWLAPCANLLVIPLLTLTLWLCFFTVILSVIIPPLAVLLGHALVPPVLLIYAIADTVSSVRTGHSLVSSPSTIALACYGLAALTLLLVLREKLRPRYGLLIGAVLLVVCVVFWKASPPEPGFYFLDVGHGDATFVYAPDGTTLLVDGGDHSDYVDNGTRVVVPFLLAHGIDRVDYVVATHADRDHIGGLVAVLDTLEVGTLVLGPTPSGKPLEETLIAHAQARGVSVRRVAAGDEFAMTGAQAHVLHPPRDYDPGTGTNDLSVVLRVSWPGLSVLLPGDIEWDAEQKVSATACQSAVLKAPHHGSSTSSGEPLIAAVAPHDAVISTRATSRKPGTGLGVLERYAAHGVRVWRTDHHGGISLTVRDGRAVFSGERITRGYVDPPHF